MIEADVVVVGAGFHDVTGNQVIAGFGQRVVDRLAEYGGTPGHIRDDVGYTATRTPVNHVELALAEATLLADAGVEIWPNAAVVDASREAGRVTRLHVRTPYGQRTILPGVLIDCTGDGAVAALAGARSHDDAGDRRQPASLLFNLGGVDFGELLAYARAHPDDFRQGSRRSSNWPVGSG